ncbi:hypothetical protein B6S44_27890 [Bosea sp. Tri-44]|nr:hypothetical protein B6S44_27890 [Bosea sp. Tri-44]
MNPLLLLVGPPIDLQPAIMLLGPNFVPLPASIELDPIQLGIIIIIMMPVARVADCRHPSAS